MNGKCNVCGEWDVDDLHECKPLTRPSFIMYRSDWIPNIIERPTIVCLCGSTRFYEAFQKANYDETMADKIVLSVGHYPNSDGSHGEVIGCTPEQKEKLDELHKRKIDLADEVLILNVDGYIGMSTKGELNYAIMRGKIIRWLEPDSNHADGSRKQAK